jgi:hypothetical protein
MSGVGTLAGEKYISPTTFTQDGTPVATPVWVVSDDVRRLPPAAQRLIKIVDV